jgi:hypothetical protein
MGGKIQKSTFKIQGNSKKPRSRLASRQNPGVNLLPLFNSTS